MNQQNWNSKEREFFDNICRVIEEHSPENNAELREKLKNIFTNMRNYYSGNNEIQCWSCGEFFNSDDDTAVPEERYCGHC